MMASLFSWLAQGGVAIVVLVVIIELTSIAFKRRPALMHLLWLAVLIRLVIPISICWPGPIELIQRYSTIVSAAIVEQHHLRAAINFHKTESLDSQENPPLTANEEKMSETNLTIPRSSTSIGNRLTAGELLIAICIGLWIPGCCVIAYRRYIDVRRSVRLCKAALPSPKALTDEVDRLSRRIGIRHVQSRVTAWINSPVIFCFGPPMLLWPEACLESIPENRTVIAHELAHIRRHDNWVVWIELVAGCLWWWHPLYWHLRSRLFESADLACDAEAVSLTNEIRTCYARRLIDCSRRTASSSESTLFSLSVASVNHIRLERRLKMILDDQVISRVGKGGLVLALLFFVAAVPSFAVDPPTSGEPKLNFDPTARPESLRDVVKKGDVERTRALLTSGANPNDFERGNGIPIIVDAIEQPEIVRLLIDHGANLKRRISFMGMGVSSGWSVGFEATSLHYAVLKGNPNTVQLLIKSGLDPNATDSAGQTPLHIALQAETNRKGVDENNYISIIRCLLDHDASLQLKDKDGRTPLDLAKYIESPKEFVSMLESKQQDIDTRYRELLSTSHSPDGR